MTALKFSGPRGLFEVVHRDLQVLLLEKMLLRRISMIATYHTFLQDGW